MTLNPITASIYLPALGAIADDLGVSIAVVQLALTGYYLGVAVGVMFGGPLTDALGRRSVLLVGLGVLAAATVAVALAPAAPILIGARVLQGLGSSTAIVVVRAIVSDVARGRQAARAFSVLMGILAAGPLVAPLLGTALPSWAAGGRSSSDFSW
ncbi:MFS transporter [Microbacterium elymi]|uniref:MFS transporter n=1 Tax=Microbacterium elymi TaxID=2909587 RepID=A0ABY5NHJ5_9MICO|nr:MFS transporter [Microbacterium elymi]UUT34599.1 MFS transporter [Microbacterium elymi]